MIDEKAVKWKKVTCQEARKSSDEEVLVWWRPSGIINKEKPEEDIAWVMME